MLTPQEQALGNRVLACSCFRWREGMRRYYTADGFYERCSGTDNLRISGQIPDCTDAATVGCLLALLREVTNMPHLIVAPSHISPEGTAVMWQVHNGKQVVFGQTEVEAIIATLELADASLDHLALLLDGVADKLRKVVGIAEAANTNHRALIGEWRGDTHTAALKDALAFFKDAAGAYREAADKKEAE
jgi:hypothetical protein